MLKRVHVDWWHGYETLIVAEPPQQPDAGQVAELRDFIRRERPTLYSPIPFEEFLWVPPWRHNPEERWFACGPPDVDGKRVVDVGASVGYYTFLAAASGAKKVVAVETDAKAAHILVALAEMYGFDNVEVSNGRFERMRLQFRKFDVAFAFSVLPYLGRTAPAPLRKVLANMAKYIGVSFIEMGDGGSGLDWCQGDDQFRALFEEAGFAEVNQAGQMFSSHTNTYRTLWRCDGKK
jgi:SAM-dependent methyltransferase